MLENTVPAQQLIMAGRAFKQAFDDLSSPHQSSLRRANGHRSPLFWRCVTDAFSQAGVAAQAVPRDSIESLECLIPLFGLPGAYGKNPSHGRCIGALLANSGIVQVRIERALRNARLPQLARELERLAQIEPLAFDYGITLRDFERFRLHPKEMNWSWSREFLMARATYRFI